MAAFVRSRFVSRTLLKLPRCAEGLTGRSFFTGWVPQENHKFISRRIIMTRTSALLFILVVCFATAMQAQAPAPKPGPEVKQLRALVGHWTYEGEYKPGPLGPGGKYTGEFTCQMILGGFFLQIRWTEKGPAGETRGLEIDGYDPVNKNLSAEAYSDDGSRFSGVVTVTGNTRTYAGKAVAAGKQYQIKDSLILAPDLTSATEKAEISADGKTWTPLFESKWTKVQPATKK
jgi:hypothetical protein